MNVLFRNEYNYLSEAKYFLMLYYANEDFMTLDEYLKKKSGYNDKLKKSLHNLQAVYTDILHACEPLSDSIKIYFDNALNENTLFSCLADCMLVEGEGVQDVALEDIGTHVKECFHKNNKAFTSSILEADDLYPLKNMSDQEFMSAIDKLDIKDDTKWNIWRVYSNFDEHIDALISVIQRLVPIMKKVYLRHQNNFIENIDYWKTSCDKNEFFERLKEIVPMNLNESKGNETLIVVPSLMASSSLRLFTLNEEGFIIMHIGILLKEQGVLLDHANFTRDDICNRFKLLSDTSKYEILFITKNNKMYGSQLAEHLQLTTATISHHVSALTNVGLLLIEKDSNRVYYQLNKERIGFIIDQLRKDLYED